MTGKVPQKVLIMLAVFFSQLSVLEEEEEEESKLIYDQRKLNRGRPDGDFQIFYSELDTMGCEIVTE